MQRSKARRSQAIKGTPGRVADLKDAAQFEKLSSKYSDRLIVLLTYTVRKLWPKVEALQEKCCSQASAEIW